MKRGTITSEMGSRSGEVPGPVPPDIEIIEGSPRDMATVRGSVE
jgi:hypothetical protein